MFIFRNTFLGLFLLFAFTNFVHAADPCQTIQYLDGSNETILDCDNPFNVTSANAPIIFQIDGQVVAEDATVKITGSSTNQLQFDWNNNAFGYQPQLFLHTSDDYVEQIFGFISPAGDPTEQEYRDLFQASFPPGTDVEKYVTAAVTGDEDNLTDAEQDIFYDLLDPFLDEYYEPKLPNITAGTYTVLFTEELVCVSYNQTGSWLAKLRELFIPTVYAQVCPGTPRVYTLTFTVTEEVVEPEPEIDPLLLEYAPILYMHPLEDYFPMDVETFVEDSALWSQSGSSDTQLYGADELTFSVFETVVESDNTANYYWLTVTRIPPGQ